MFVQVRSIFDHVVPDNLRSILDDVVPANLHHLGCGPIRGLVNLKELKEGSSLSS